MAEARTEPPSAGAGGGAPAGEAGAAAPAQPAAQPAAAPQVNVALGMGRAMATWQLFTVAKGEYEQALKEAGEDPAARAAALERMHDKWAEKALDLCKRHGGIYNKAAQFVATLQAGAGDKVIPLQYINTLKVLTDKAPSQDIAAMAPLFEAEFGGRGKDEVFGSLQDVPLAAASLAQVHKGTTKAGQPVAVKLQYPQLRDQLASDFSVFHMLGSQIKPGGFDLTWVVRDFREALTMELDFTGEAANAVKFAKNFAHRDYVRVPAVVQELTTPRVLTMEFVGDMVRCDDPDALRAAGLDVAEVSQKLSDTFAEMLFCTGFVHGDPHAGNVYARRSASGAAEIVVLDHGLYHTMDEGVRKDLCAFVLACATRDSRKMRALGVRFAGPLHHYFPLILSPWFIFGGTLRAEDIQAAQEKRMPPGVKVDEIGKFLVNLHDSAGNILGVLHSMGYTRGILQAAGFPEKRRIKSLVKFAAMGLHGAGAGELPPAARLQVAVAQLYVELLAVLIFALSLVVKVVRLPYGPALLAALAGPALAWGALRLYAARDDVLAVLAPRALTAVL